MIESGLHWIRNHCMKGSKLDIVYMIEYNNYCGIFIFNDVSNISFNLVRTVVHY